MQARLRSDRIHAAAIASLPYWEGLLQETHEKHEAQIIEQMKRFLRMKTWCGGFKYNEISAREMVVNPSIFDKESWYARCRSEEIAHIKKAITTVKSLIEKTGQGTKPFPILLSEYEFGLIWDEV